MTEHQQSPDGESVDRWRRWLRRATRGKAATGAPEAPRPQGTGDAGRADTPPPATAPATAPATTPTTASAGKPPTRWVAVLAGQEGVGQTTVTAVLGLALAHHRAGRVIAVDADPRHGTLADRSTGTATFTAGQVMRGSYMADAFARLPADARHRPLHVLATDAGADAGARTGAATVPNRETLEDHLSRHYSTVLTDPGTALVHAAMRGILDTADAVVLVSGAGADEARRAAETLSWLQAHGRGDLAGRAIVVLNHAAAAGRATRPEEAEAHFAARVPHVIGLPHDPHLAGGSRIELARLRPATRAAVLELAALLTAELKD